MKIGSMFERITKFLEIPHCENCEKTKQELDRRGFMGLLSMAVAFVLAKSTPLLAGFVPPEEEDVNGALSLMRMLNARVIALKTTTEHADGSHTHVYPSKGTLLKSLVDLINSEEAADELRRFPEDRPFWESLKPLSPTGEIYPGWITDIDVRPDHGYVIVTRQKGDSDTALVNVLITDEMAVIYRGKLPSENVPKAKSLEAALDCPGVVSHEQFKEYSQRDAAGKAGYVLAALRNRVGRGLRPISLSQCYIGCTGPKPYGCGFICLVGCIFCPSAAHPCCQEQPGLRFWAMKNCGVADCTWCYTDCSQGGSNCANCPGSPSDCSKMGACSKLSAGTVCCKCPCGVLCN